jgi:hypothetical protein
VGETGRVKAALRTTTATESVTEEGTIYSKNTESVMAKVTSDSFQVFDT